MTSKNLAIRLFVIVSTIVITTAIAVYWASSETVFGFRNPGNGVAGGGSISRLLATGGLAILMLLGCFGSALWDKVAEAMPDPDSDEVDVKRALSLTLKSSTFLKSAIVSPITFGTVYVLADAETDTVLAYLVAFETGFFWNVVFRERKKRSSGEDPMPNDDNNLNAELKTPDA